MDRADMKALEKALMEMIAWRDWLVGEAAAFDAEIAALSRTYADALGVKVKPSLAQLRQMLGVKLERIQGQRQNVDRRASVPLLNKPLSSDPGPGREGPTSQTESSNG